MKFTVLGQVDDDTAHRAIVAHFKAGYRDQTCTPDLLEDEQKRQYVVLYNVRGVLNVYRVRSSDGVLRRMIRPPEDLNELYGEDGPMWCRAERKELERQ